MATLEQPAAIDEQRRDGVGDDLDAVGRPYAGFSTFLAPSSLAQDVGLAIGARTGTPFAVVIEARP